MSEPVPSPCINVCQMDAASGWCQGCLRTLDEIACWSRMDDTEKAAVWQALDQRRLVGLQPQARPKASR